MNFFNSVFSDQPDSPQSPQSPQSETDPLEPDHSDPDETNTAWSFGGLIQTLASKSESVIENYRRDIEEFSSGLKKETAVIREAASRAVMDLPTSLDVGASVAQESLETVGQAIDDIGSSVWKSTAQIIAHGRDSLIAPDFDSDSFDSNNNDSGSDIVKKRLGSSSSLDLKRYSRFDTLVRSIQSDVNTYVEEPEDLGNYNEWKLGFELDEKREEIVDLLEENGVVEEIYEKVVPDRTDHESFWSRYFYRLHKLKQAEDARAKLVERAISGNEEEDLSWDFDDDGDDDGYEPKGNSSGVKELKEEDGGEVGSVEKDLKIESDGKDVVAVGSQSDGDKLVEVNYDENVESNVSVTVSGSADKLDVKDEEKEALEVKTDNDNSGSCKDSDISVVSSQPSMLGEEDIGWDEIEDIESNDENKGDSGGSTSRVDLRKRLSVGEQDEEDLSWDIEDDDEAVKQ
ncbi:hypothetical protein TanjilG_06852 [Lupinus angustifolius]|uniref:BSD domain-containing protein n=1 Tax=Lupinus angustifolius TaxID=3871 RepID=A0A1J7H252_LUPAN|nr:PREDICTED: protein DOS2-like [Lupinus angustifolius]OIV95876.1 hypothetical protein TanjilG_06852 [Lupinus angustifolius]